MSLRARMVRAALRRFVRPRSLVEPDPLASRAFVNRFAFPAMPGVRIEATCLGGVPAEWVRGRSAASGVLLYLHGGAYVVCSPATHRPITAAFARRGFAVLCPAYRLAPEHPCPAAVEDAVSAYRALLADGIAPDRIALAGESAGGGLALATLVRLRDLGLPLPAAAALFSPWTDLALTGGSLRTNEGRDAMFFGRHAGAVTRHYLAGLDPRDPLASPLYADLSGLPPLLIHAADDELLLDDAVRVARKVEAAGGEVRLRVWSGVWHGWQLLAALVPEARASVDGAAAFLAAGTAPDQAARRMSPASRSSAASSVSSRLAKQNRTTLRTPPSA